MSIFYTYIYNKYTYTYMDLFYVISCNVLLFLRKNMEPPSTPSTRPLVVALAVERTPQGTLNVLHDRVILERSGSGNLHVSKYIKYYIKINIIIYVATSTITTIYLYNIYIIKCMIYYSRGDRILSKVEMVSR